MVKLKTVGKWFFIALVLFFIYCPIVFLTVNSFNANDTIQEPWGGFSLTHYKYFLNFEQQYRLE